MNDLQIQAQAYSYFRAEAPELLQTIEQEILTLPAEHTIAKVHNLMRALHTLKGAAANVGLTTISSIAHNFEDVVRVFYNVEIDIDLSIQSLLLEGYSGLKECWDAQVAELEINEQLIFDRLATTIDLLKLKLGDWTQNEVVFPSSIELGFDIVASIFETTIQEQLDSLSVTIETGTLAEIELCLQSTTGICIGLAESFELPGFLAINQAIETAILQHPECLDRIASLALMNLQQAQAEVLAGDRTIGGTLLPDLEQFESLITDSQPIDLGELVQNLPLVIEVEQNLVVADGEAELAKFRLFLTSDKFRKRQELSKDTQDLFDRIIRLCWDWFRHDLEIPKSELSLELLVMTEGLANLDSLDRWVGSFLAGLSTPSDRISLRLYRQSCVYQTIFAVAKYLKENDPDRISVEFLTELRSKLQTTVSVYKEQAPVTINERGWIDRIILPHNWTNLPAKDAQYLVKLQALLIDSHHRSIDSQQRLKTIYSTNQTLELAGLITESVQLSNDLSIAIEAIAEMGDRG